MARIQLPDCSQHEDTYFALSAAEKRELVLRIAEHGPDAIEAYIKEKEAAGDSTIAARLRRLRDELVARAQELKDRLAGGFSEQQRALEEQYAEAFADLDAKRGSASDELEALRGSEARFLEEAVRGSDVVNLILSAPPPDKLSGWARWKRLWWRFVALLLAPLRWLLQLVFGKKRRGHSVTMAAPIGGRLGVDVEARAGAAYLANPALRQRVKERLRASPTPERLRRTWDRLLGREDYESIVRRVAAELVAEEADAKRTELKDKERALADELARLSDDEQRRRAELAGRISDMQREQDDEAARLERELAEAPERELKDTILDELKGTGLLTEKGGRVMPTLSFLDRFGAIVYADEARSSGRGEGATGAYAEGEGTFLREPMRAYVEIAHMDVPASLVRARQRHPHVRHLTDDDVLVYREERHALQHVVVILDRSGSMEENNRMEAAKRAALALMHAVKSENPRNRVDFVDMSTSVARIDAFGVWDAEPRGFTNTGAALRLAGDLVKEQKSERALVYLVTDGLPEAYTEDGDDVAGHPEKAREFAVMQAKRLKRVPGFGGFVCLLLEAEDEMFVAAAEELADTLDGKVVRVSPQDLAGQLIRAFEDAPAPLAP